MSLLWLILVFEWRVREWGDGRRGQWNCLDGFSMNSCNQDKQEVFAITDNRFTITEDSLKWQNKNRYRKDHLMWWKKWYNRQFIFCGDALVTDGVIVDNWHEPLFVTKTVFTWQEWHVTKSTRFVVTRVIWDMICMLTYRSHYSIIDNVTSLAE